MSIQSILIENKVSWCFSCCSPVGAVHLHPWCPGGGHHEPWHLGDHWPPPHLCVWTPDPWSIRQDAHGQAVQGLEWFISLFLCSLMWRRHSRHLSSWFLIIMLITSEHTLDMFQLISQRQAKHADYSTALRDGNAERNRARALMPGEQGCFTNSMQLLQKAM